MLLATVVKCFLMYLFAFVRFRRASW